MVYQLKRSYFNKEDLGKQTTSLEMKAYCLLSSCRRKFLCEHFGTEFVANDVHFCCDNCQQTCLCDQCVETSSQTLNDLFSESFDELHDAQIDSCIHAALQQYFSAVNGLVQTDTVLDAALHTGLTESLARDIAAKYEYLVNRDLLRETFSYLSEEYVAVIHQILAAFLPVQSHLGSEL
jgi:hypothetical protein